MTTSTLTLLREARALIEDPEHWCRGEFAKDANDRIVGPSSLEAVAWCGLGAISRYQRILPALEFLQDAASDLYSSRITKVNDELGHAAVLKVYDRAIEMAESS